MKPTKIFLIAEFIAIYVSIPLLLALTHAPRYALHACLWLLTIYSLLQLRRTPGFSWRGLWHGRGWAQARRDYAVWRFLAILPFLVAITWFVIPERFFTFPMQRPGLWALVMLLYPLLSVIPQEIVLRSFFFERYASLFPKRMTMIVANAFCFGFAHIMMSNWIAPSFCIVGGVMFASSYAQHRSLKWVSIEHAAYGCLLFTLGLGWFFFASGSR